MPIRSIDLRFRRADEIRALIEDCGGGPSPNEAFHERIQGMASEKQGGEPGAAALDGSDQGWHFPKRYFEEIKKEIDAYRLIPLETVGLTDMSGFETSMDDALAYFEKKSRFDSMIDINKARENGVTPLPISARVK